MEKSVFNALLVLQSTLQISCILIPILTLYAAGIFDRRFFIWQYCSRLMRSYISNQKQYFMWAFGGWKYWCGTSWVSPSTWKLLLNYNRDCCDCENIPQVSKLLGIYHFSDFQKLHSRKIRPLICVFASWHSRIILYVFWNLVNNSSRNILNLDETKLIMDLNQRMDNFEAKFNSLKTFVEGRKLCVHFLSFSFFHSFA